MTDIDTISGTCTNGPLVISREVFRALGPLEQVAALALEKVKKIDSDFYEYIRTCPEKNMNFIKPSNSNYPHPDLTVLIVCPKS